MKKLDEIEIIRIFQKKFGRGASFVPEDLEILPTSGKKFMVKTDMLVQSTDMPPGMSLKQAARKSIVSCVSDFACKGVKPRYAVISLAIPQAFTRKMIHELADGFAEASREFSVKIVGGDVNQGKETVIDVSMFGTGGRMVRRRGARSGDVIVTSGPFGYHSSGLKMLLHGCKSDPAFAKKCKKSVLYPRPRLEFGLRASRYFTSSMDSSDGLSLTLNDMSRISKKQFIITRIPTEREIAFFAEKNCLGFMDLVFCGGEEYEIVATLSKADLPAVARIAARLGVPLYAIGFVREGKNVMMIHGRHKTILRPCGWVHFRSRSH
ncbi:MAG: thiamine-phosphate kinase [Thaumarchaeota archaeon]|nr:thiamine-phosphate kinase [Nitrososphaerota archaeon]